MPKTNHNRDFRDERDYTVDGGDYCRGKHGAAKNKRGQKKFRRSRQRFHQNQQIPRLIDADTSLEPTKHDSVMRGHSKLRQTSTSGCNPSVCFSCGKETNILVIVEPLTGLCKACSRNYGPIV